MKNYREKERQCEVFKGGGQEADSDEFTRGSFFAKKKNQ